MQRVARAGRLLTLALVASLVALACGGPGFTSRRHFEEHYRKHAREFGNITAREYLCLAQDLRDARPGGPILEDTRRDGVMTKFDRRHGYFGAYNRDGTIRTFFIPVDGERYFRRQAARSHD
jgi:pyocin large subunit-like protein